MITFGSVCSGIEAASTAWESLGFQANWFSEIEAFPSAVLAHHWPEVVNLGDMTKIAAAVRAGSVSAPMVLVGGTPCQAFSVAGARAGLSDPRGQLTISYVDLANAIDQQRAAAGEQPAVIVWENVPGVLSDKGNAFGAFLGLLAGEDCELQPTGKRWSNAGCVFGPQRTVAWRILDAQYFGVAQRRRRVFVVASARADFDPTKVLFELEGVRRDTAPRRGQKEGASADAGSSSKVGSHWDSELNPHPTLNQSFNTGGIGASNQEIFSQRGSGIIPANCEVTGAIAAHSFTGGAGGRPEGAAAGHFIPVCTSTWPVSHCLNAGGMGRIDYETETMVVHGTPDAEPAARTVSLRGRDGGATAELGDEVATCLRASSGGGDKPHVLHQMSVRRLTPVECERLQGFPDNHTLIPVSKRKQITADEYAYLRSHFPTMTAEEAYRQAADGPRYKAIGNSMAVPVMHWIGARIKQQLERNV